MNTISKIGAIGALAFLCFVWGVVATSTKIFPHHQIVRVQNGIDAIGKMEDSELPQHVIALTPDASRTDPIQSFAPVTSDDLILMTGGFFYRQDQCPNYGCMAFITDHEGKILHKWEFDPAGLFTPDDFKAFTGYPDPRNLNVQGVDMDADGNLIVVFQGRNVFPYQVGIAKFDWNSKLLWIKIDNSHHWPKVGPDGRIYTPIAKIERGAQTVAATPQPSECKSGAIFQEGVRVLAPDGTTLKEFWMKDVVKASDMQGLAYSVRNDCDPYHVNGIDLVTAATAARLPELRAGDLLVSLRSSSALVVLDQDTGLIKHIVSGPMVAQHSPHALLNGNFAVFDNLGGLDTENGTRVLEINSISGVGRTLFPRDKSAPGGDLSSDAQGTIAFSADQARMLVGETLGGRVFEVDTATGAPLWQYDLISDLAPFYKSIGKEKSGPTYGRMQAQGARYVTRADFDRMMAQ